MNEVDGDVVVWNLWYGFTSEFANLLGHDYATLDFSQFSSGFSTIAKPSSWCYIDFV